MSTETPTLDKILDGAQYRDRTTETWTEDERDAGAIMHLACQTWNGGLEQWVENGYAARQPGDEETGIDRTIAILQTLSRTAKLDSDKETCREAANRLRELHTHLRDTDRAGCFASYWIDDPEDEASPETHTGLAICDRFDDFFYAGADDRILRAAEEFFASHR